jgi:transposase
VPAPACARSDISSWRDRVFIPWRGGAEARAADHQSEPPAAGISILRFRLRAKGLTLVLWPRRRHGVAAHRRRRDRHHRGGSQAPQAAILFDKFHIMRHKTTESGGPCGFDAGKKVRGRKRHIVTDTCGSLLAVQVHAANIQGVHGAVPLLKYIGLIFPKLRHIFADRVYCGKQLPEALAEFGKWITEIVTRSQSVGTFNAERKRWVIE